MAATDQPISETAIANMAATTLDEKHISSLDEDTVIGRFMASQFGFARDELLSSYPWVFATKRAILTPDADAPEFGFTYQYTLPADCLRVRPINYDGVHDGRPVTYVREGRKILTNEGTALKIRYVYRLTNAAVFDPLFARALGERLALLAATRMTGKQSYLAKAASLYKQALEDAVTYDALDSGTPETQNRYDIIDTRLAG